MKLIFDRTQEDLQKVLDIRAKLTESGWNSLTDDEKVDWVSCALKGSYNYTDRNRVETAVNIINKKLMEYGYIDYELEVITDRDMQTIDEFVSIKRYLDNIQILMEKFFVLATTPELPSSLDGIDIEKANNIEKILFDLNNIISYIENDYVRMGVGNMGAVRFWQQGFRYKNSEVVEDA